MMVIMRIRTASPEEIYALSLNIKEFQQPYPRTEFDRRLSNVRYLGLVAETDEVLGFKLGYQLDPYCFYSWLGGVVAPARGQGVASLLLQEQERWVAEQGYKVLRVKTRNRFPAMLRLLIKCGYMIDGFDAAQDPLDNRLLLSKVMSSS